VSGGARAITALAPGVLDRLYVAGAQHLNLPGRYLGQGAAGWLPRFTGPEYLIGVSRELLEAALRAELIRHPNVEVLDRTTALGLLGDPRGITGAVVRGQDEPEPRPLPANLVVDATGRRSHAPVWLRQLGFPRVPESVVDPGVYYASALFRAPAAAGPDFPGISVQTSPAATTSVRRGGMLIPIEDGQWMITLCGAGISRPGTSESAFREFAASLPHPAIARLIESATPLGRPYGFRADANRLRHYEALRPVPHGFLALGDSYATFNPVYGHGVAVAALGAVALREGLLRHGSGDTRAVQLDIARACRGAWRMAVRQDLRYPQTVGRRPRRLRRLLSRLLEKVTTRISAAGKASREVAAARMAVYALAAPTRILFHPKVLLATLLRRGVVRTEPPFTAAESALLQQAPGHQLR
ncbi:NAD(P)/FAD-dependent oxidoreductase, partial [Crossiella equi]